MESRPALLSTLAPKNPRRVPHHQSVSLRRKNITAISPLRNQYTGDDEPESNSGSSSSARLITKESSGESSNADKWFEKSNKHPNLHQRDFKDDDPPFQPNMQTGNANAAVYAHMQSIPAHLLASESSSDEYRGVIDDLTVQLKKLQKKLSKYERTQDNRLDTVKRIEVKTYGLCADKKRQLEQILSKFSEDLDSSSSAGHKASTSSMLNSSSMAKDGSSSLSRNPFIPGRMKTVESQTNDSGYGSLATLGAPQSNTMMSYSAMRRAPETATSPQAKNQSIENYLHDIPLGLLPRQTVAMTEKAKKKLVVKRLEQILGGRDALPGVHHQSIQQQEVAQSAAIAERSAMDSLGQVYAAEGTREAPIMPNSDDENLGLADLQPEATQGVPMKTEHVNEKDFAATAGKDHHREQRPTRPLDLDPDRAQTPMENVRYLRHLGFIQDDKPLAPSSDNEGWIYLNLMINLAQLHTLNVTPEFVQDAIARYSDHFELSSDGRKVRWSHRAGPSKSSVESSSGLAQQHNPVNKLRKRNLVQLAINEPEAPRNQHLYTPMFLSKEETMSDDTASIPEEDTFPEGGNDHEDASGLASGSGPAVPTRRRDDAPMIFYHQAKFYTDLSADKIPAMTFATYQRGTPLGEKPIQRARRDSAQPSHRPLVDSAPIPEDVIDMDDDELIDLDFPATSPRRVTFVDPDEKEPEFAVSGLGGVYPDDHFAITVQRRHAPSSPNASTTKTHTIPNRLFNSIKQEPLRCHSSVISTKRASLLPSELPPPCYDVNSDSESDSGNDSDSSSQSGTGPAPSTTDLPRLATLSTFGAQHDQNKRRRLNTSRQASSTSSTSTISSSHRAHANRTSRINYSPSASSSSSSSSSGGSQAESHRRGAPSMSEGIDFLAHARRVDPELIGRAERQYDAEMAERLAEEIPAGSSAATAGGGSGWGSPIGAGRGKRKRSKDDAYADIPDDQHVGDVLDEGAESQMDGEDSDEDVERGSVSS